MVELGVPRVLVEGRLGRVERLVQLVPRSEAAGQAVERAPVVALNRKRFLELLLRILEQANSPQRVGVVRQRLGILGRAPRQQLAVRISVREIAQAQRSLDGAGQRLALDARFVVPLDLLEGVNASR